MDKKKLEDLLRERGLKVTSKRLTLLNVIARKSSAIARTEIQKKTESFDRVTLYRTLNALIKGGIIHIAHKSSNEVYYAMCKHHCNHKHHNHNHIHFKCNSCLEITCVETENNITIDLPNFKVNQVNIEITGICANCN